MIRVFGIASYRLEHRERDEQIDDRLCKYGAVEYCEGTIGICALYIFNVPEKRVCWCDRWAPTSKAYCSFRGNSQFVQRTLKDIALQYFSLIRSAVAKASFRKDCLLLLLLLLVIPLTMQRLYIFCLNVFSIYATISFRYTTNVNLCRIIGAFSNLCSSFLEMLCAQAIEWRELGEEIIANSLR